MTSTQLADMIVGYQAFAEQKILITADEVYAAGAVAQREICSDGKILTARGILVLVNGQGTYHKREFPVTAVDTPETTTCVIHCAGHDLRVGDSFVLSLPNMADSRRGEIRVASAVTADTVTIADYVAGTISGTLGTGNNRICHALVAAAGLIGEGIGYRGADAVRKGWLTERGLRGSFHDYLSVETFGVISRYEKIQSPQGLELRLYDTPTADGEQVEFDFYRQPVTGEELSATVNPLLTTGMHDLLLYAGTLYYVLALYHRTATLKDLR